MAERIIRVEEPVAWLEHEATNYNIAVFKRINRFQRFMYRVITGACSAGTRNFCENILSDKREKYSVAEVIQLTKGQFGNETFKDFFNK